MCDLSETDRKYANQLGFAHPTVLQIPGNIGRWLVIKGYARAVPNAKSHIRGIGFYQATPKAIEAFVKEQMQMIRDTEARHG